MQQTSFSNNIIRVVCLVMLVTQASSYKLFLSHPGFPSFPVAGIFGGWPEAVQQGLFFSSLALMLFTVFKPVKPVVALLLFLQLVICMADQNRLQPWQYQFMFMLGVYVFVENENQRRFGWQFILIGTYFFSALWKFNPAFIYEIWLGFILKRWLHIYDIPSWAFRAGYLLPLAEIFAVMLICYRPFRRWGMWILIGMHSFVLLMMGPLGLNVNYVLWPWNLSMIVLLFLLFQHQGIEWTRQQLKPVFNFLVIICWGVLPWLQAGKLWDRYLSSVLFSGGAPYMYITTTNAVAKKEMAEYFFNNCTLPNGRAVSTYEWGQKEMHTTPYPEERSFRNIAKAWKEKYADSSARFFVSKAGFQPELVEITVAGAEVK